MNKKIKYFIIFLIILFLNFLTAKSYWGSWETFVKDVNYGNADLGATYRVYCLDLLKDKGLLNFYNGHPSCSNSGIVSLEIVKTLRSFFGIFFPYAYFLTITIVNLLTFLVIFDLIKKFNPKKTIFFPFIIYSTIFLFYDRLEISTIFSTFFGIVGLYALLEVSENAINIKKNQKNHFITAILFSLSFFSKQSSGALIFATFILLLIKNSLEKNGNKNYLNIIKKNSTIIYFLTIFLLVYLIIPNIYTYYFGVSSYDVNIAKVRGEMLQRLLMPFSLTPNAIFVILIYTISAIIFTSAIQNLFSKLYFITLTIATIILLYGGGLWLLFFVRYTFLPTLPLFVISISTVKIDGLKIKKIIFYLLIFFLIYYSMERFYTNYQVQVLANEVHESLKFIPKIDGKILIEYSSKQDHLLRLYWPHFNQTQIVYYPNNLVGNFSKDIYEFWPIVVDAMEYYNLTKRSNWMYNKKETEEYIKNIEKEFLNNSYQMILYGPLSWNNLYYFLKNTSKEVSEQVNTYSYFKISNLFYKGFGLNQLTVLLKNNDVHIYTYGSIIKFLKSKEENICKISAYEFNYIFNTVLPNLKCSTKFLSNDYRLDYRKLYAFNLKVFMITLLLLILILFKYNKKIKQNIKIH